MVLVLNTAKCQQQNRAESESLTVQSSRSLYCPTTETEVMGKASGFVVLKTSLE